VSASAAFSMLDCVPSVCILSQQTQPCAAWHSFHEHTVCAALTLADVLVPRCCMMLACRAY
jgi:hypothetical protein